LNVAVLGEAYSGNHIRLEEIEKLKAIEKNSHRVIYVADTGSSIVFYMTQIEGKWFMSIFDRWYNNI
jgi:hypothetical protein